MKTAHYKKVALVLCLMMALLIGLVGCVAVSSPTATEESVESTTTVTPTTETEVEAETEGATTRTIETVMGNIEVPIDPQRVVVNWYLGDAATLGLNIVGYYAGLDPQMPFYDAVSDVHRIENWAAEDILALEPDFIITWDAADFDNYAKIAPVLVITEEPQPIDRIRIIAAATGREAEAEAAIATFEERLAAAKERLTGDDFKDKTFSIFQDWGASSYGMYYESESRGGKLIYEYLGLQMPETMQQLIADTGESRGSLSYEVAANYIGDYLVWFLTEQESEFAQTEIWNSIPAVQAGNIIAIPADNLMLFYYSDVASMTAQIDYIIDALNAVVQ